MPQSGLSSSERSKSPNSWSVMSIPPLPGGVLLAGDGAVLDGPAAAGAVADLLAVGVPAFEGFAVEEGGEAFLARGRFGLGEGREVGQAGAQGGGEGASEEGAT